MGTYVAVDLIILVLPLALSFDKRVAFYRRWASAVPAICIVAAPYLLWDVWATHAGHWAFNPVHAGSMRIAGLPPGELLFFFVVPYACLFTYEVVRAYGTERVLPLRPRSLALCGVMFLALGVGVPAALAALGGGFRTYTFAAGFSAGAFLLILARFRPDLAASRLARIWMAIVYLAFLISNGILTGLPIVTYGSEAILGLRIFSIPLEDFFYNFAFLGFVLLVYRTLEDRRTRRQ